MTVYVFVDVQNDFITGALANPAAKAALPAVREVAVEAYENGCPIICTRDTHNDKYLNTQEGKNLPIPHCYRFTWGWEVPAEVINGCGYINYLNKGSFGASPDCWKQLLTDLMTEYDQPITKIVVCGFVSSICVISNIMVLKALYPEIEIEFRAKASAGLTPEDHEAACKVLECCQVKVVRE